MIAILASLTLIGYQKVQASSRGRARAADLTSMRQALERYYTKHGAYPVAVSAGSTAPAYQRRDGVNFLRELVPQTIAELPTVTNGDTSSATSNTYRYSTNAQQTEYKLVYVQSSAISGDELSAVPEVMRVAGKTDQYGVWSSGGAGL